MGSNASPYFYREASKPALALCCDFKNSMDPLSCKNGLRWKYNSNRWALPFTIFFSSKRVKSFCISSIVVKLPVPFFSLNRFSCIYKYRGCWSWTCLSTSKQINIESLMRNYVKIRCVYLTIFYLQCFNLILKLKFRWWIILKWAISCGTLLVSRKPENARKKTKKCA